MPDYVSSAGITVLAHGYDSTSRKDVLRRVVIPVVPGTAARALPRSGRKGELCEQVPAVGAGLARRIEPVDHDQPSSGPARLVLQLTPETAPGSVVNRLRRMPVLDHVRGCEILDDDHIVLAHQPCGRSVQVIGAGVAALEPRIPGTAGVEVRERSMLMPQHPLRRYRGHLVEEREFVGLLPAGQRTIRLGIRRRLPFGREPDLTLGERPVPHQADATERSARQRLLLRVRVCPAPIRHSHLISLSGENLARSAF